MADSYRTLSFAKHLGRILILPRSRVHIDIWFVLAAHIGRPTFGVFEGTLFDGVVAGAREVLAGLIGPQILTLSLRYFSYWRLPLVLYRITIILAGAWIEVAFRLVLSAHCDTLGSFAESVRLVHIVTRAWNLAFEFFLPEIFSLSRPDPYSACLLMSKTLLWLIIRAWTRIAVLYIFARRVKTETTPFGSKEAR